MDLTLNIAKIMDITSQKKRQTMEVSKTIVYLINAIEKFEARESLEKLLSERIGRYLIFLTYICNSNINFYQPFLWKYLQATISSPVNEFTPLIIKVILEHSSKQLVEAYGQKFKQLLQFIKRDHMEWQRKMDGAKVDHGKSNDFVDKMYEF